MAGACEPVGKRKRRRPEAEDKELQGICEKKPRRSLRIAHNREAQQLQNDIISRYAQVSDEGIQSNSAPRAIQRATRRTPLDSDLQSNQKRAAKSSNPEQQRQKRPREEEVLPSRTSPGLPPKRGRASVASVRETIGEARIEFWSEKGTWPTDEQEATMDRFRQLVDHARARKRSVSRKRSNASLTSDTTPTQIGGSVLRDQKCAPYKHPLFERQLKECGSFMDEYELGITAESKDLCHKLLNGSQPVPQSTLFSDDGLFKKTCRRTKGENETKVVHRISQFIVPSAEILADKGAKHLAIVRETTNACWTNSEPFIHPPRSGSSSQSGLRPQPDFGFGFDRDAFSTAQLQKLQPFFGDLLRDYSLFAATYQMYLPFLTCEVKCGDGGLDVADRQNAYSQSVILRGLHSLFQLVGREKELHREISGFSISHNDEDVRIWGHYVVIDGNDTKFYRHLISKFIFAPSGEGDQRWKAWKFVKNVYDLWLPKHFRSICSAIDMLPADLTFEISELPKLQSPDSDLESLRSGLSQQLEDYSLANERVTSNSQTKNP